MFGYAVNETSRYLPATLALSHLLLQELDDLRREGKVMPYLRPDATVVYNDFDNYRERLTNIPHTNKLLADLREIVGDSGDKTRITGFTRDAIIERIEREDP